MPEVKQAVDASAILSYGDDLIHRCITLTGRLRSLAERVHGPSTPSTNDAPVAPQLDGFLSRMHGQQVKAHRELDDLERLLSGLEADFPEKK